MPTPARMLCAGGLAVMEKFLTFSVAVAVNTRFPLVAVTVKA